MEKVPTDAQRALFVLDSALELMEVHGVCADDTERVVATLRDFGATNADARYWLGESLDAHAVLGACCDDNFYDEITDATHRVARALIDYRSVVVCDPRQWLLCAFSRGDVKLVEWLVVAHDAEICDYNTAVQATAAHGHVAMMAWLVERGGVNVYALELWALRPAVVNGHVAMVAWLAARGANARTNNDYALLLAAENGRVTMVAWLVERGANARVDYDHALCLAAGRGHVAMVAWLVAHSAYTAAEKTRAAQVAAKNRHFAVEKLLLEQDSEARATS